MKRLFFLLPFFLPQLLAGQWQLSPQAEIRIITGGPYQGELYSAFGHSAVRVYDPVAGLDLLYNYGVFDFEQPNFYLNFARGRLNYQLATGSYRGFIAAYRAEGRYVKEQILNLNPGQKQAYFNFLQVNALPENRTYAYDYFYDNCATRVWEGLKAALGPSLRLNSQYVATGPSIRDLCDDYLRLQPWGDVGIDLCLGLPMDKKASAYEHMFLPDYLHLAMSRAEVRDSTGWRPLVRQEVQTLAAQAQAVQGTAFRPWMAATLLLILGVGLSLWGGSRGGFNLWFDGLFFSLLGILGWLLLGLWLLTDHRAAAQNFNLLWALPLWFPALYLLLKNRKYHRLWLFAGIWYLLVLLSWLLWPQDLHLAFLPLAGLAAYRSFYRYRMPQYQHHAQT